MRTDRQKEKGWDYSAHTVTTNLAKQSRLLQCFTRGRELYMKCQGKH